MTGDPRLRGLFLQAFLEAETVARDLAVSVARARRKVPLSASDIGRLDDDAKEMLDAFAHRFAKLQDITGRRLFRALLELELEPVREKSMLDVVNDMEKRGIVPSVDEWADARTIRNSLEHEYPDDPGRKADVLNRAIALAPVLIRIVADLGSYATAHLGIAIEHPPSGNAIT